MNNIIPWKSSGWKHLPDPICKSLLGRDGADGIFCTQCWAVAGGQASLVGWAKSQRLFGMAGGLCVCHLWGGYYKQGQVILVKTGGRKGMHAVGGGQHWPTGAQSTLQGERPAPTDKCRCAWGLQGQRGTPCSPTWGMWTFSWERQGSL